MRLCRPFGDGGRHAVPASNREIAAELVLSEEAIMSHMHALFERLDIKDLPQRLKRACVAELAISAGVVTSRDFERPPRPRADPTRCTGSVPGCGRESQIARTGWVARSRHGRVWTNCYYQFRGARRVRRLQVLGRRPRNHKMMLDPYSQTTCLLVSYDENPMGLF